MVEHVAFAIAHFEHGGNDRFDHAADAPGEGRIVVDHGLGRFHRAAGFVPHDDDQRHAQFGNRIFDRSQRDGVDRVARIADDEQFAQAAAEEDFGRYAAVGTGNIGREGRLALRDLQPPLASHRGRGRYVVEEVAIALDQEIERLVGRQSGLAVDHGGKPRGDRGLSRSRTDPCRHGTSRSSRTGENIAS